MAEAIALIVAGTGAASEQEVFDLLNDKYDGETDVTLIVPIDKAHFSKTVEAAVDWFVSDESIDPKRDIATVQVDGGSMSRKAAALGEGAEKVDKFAEIFADDFDGFDVIDFVIALPDPPADDAGPEDIKAYDEHVDWVEAALDTKRDITVLNLCRGLDDVVLTEPEAPEEEPEPEEEKPARKPRASRAKKPEPVEDPVETDEEAAAEDPPPARKPRASRAARGSAKADEEEPKKGVVFSMTPEIREALLTLDHVQQYLLVVDQSAALFNLQEPGTKRPLTEAYEKALAVVVGVFADPSAVDEPVEAPKAVQEAEDASEPPKRPIGRPRTNFEQREHWDPDEEEWVKPGKGKPRKGTKWRLRNTDTDEILDEGIV